MWSGDEQVSVPLGTAFLHSTGPGSRDPACAGLRPLSGKLLPVGLSEPQVGAMLDLPTAQHLKTDVDRFQPPKYGASTPHGHVSAPISTAVIYGSGK